MSKRPDPQPPQPERKPIAPIPQPKPQPKPRPKVVSPWPWRRTVRIAVTLAILFHLIAVFSAPWAIQLSDSITPTVEPGARLSREQLRDAPPQRAELPIAIASKLRHYQNLLFINNGYNFFSPDPGVSHLIEYTIFDELGQEIATGRLPDRQVQRPRLFYHRHMMLVEQSAEPPPGAEGWEFNIANRLMEVHNGEAIRLALVRHHLLTPDQVKAGEKIDGKSTYEQLAVIEHRRQRPAADASANQPAATQGKAP